MLRDLAEQIIRQVDFGRFSVQSVKEVIAKDAGRQALAVGFALVKDIAAHALPGVTQAVDRLIDGVQEIREESSGRALADRLAKAGREDVFAGFLTLLELLAKGGTRGCILIDQIDAASEAVLQAIISLVNLLPDNWSLLLAVNDETPQGIEARGQCWPALSYKNGIEVPVPSLEMPALTEWYRDAKGAAPTPQQLDYLANNLGGRPLFVKEWLMAPGGELAPGRMLDRLAPHYEKRLESLSPSARRLVCALGLFPPGTRFPFKVCAVLAEEDDPFMVAEHLAELEGRHFLERSEAEEWGFAHPLVHIYTAECLPKPARPELARLCLTALAEAAEWAGEVPNKFAALRLHANAGDFENVRRLAPGLGRLMIDRGAYGPALEAFNLLKQNPEAVPADATEASIGAASALLASGHYQKGLEEVERIAAPSLPPKQRADLMLVRGQLNVRLNRYELARADLADALRGYSEAGETMGALEARRELNTVLRDLGRYSDAVVDAQELVNDAQSAHAPELVLAGCKRALARSLALAGQGEAAARTAREALDLAKAALSLRAEGNAWLALGEACRFSGKYAEAVDAYSRAVEAASRVGNVDSELWALLGISDALLLAGDRTAAREMLERMDRVTALTPDRHPLESLHRDFSTTTLDLLDGDAGALPRLEAVASRYKQLGISWPAAYVIGLRSETEPSPKKY